MGQLCPCQATIKLARTCDDKFYVHGAEIRDIVFRIGKSACGPLLDPLISGDISHSSISRLVTPPSRDGRDAQAMTFALAASALSRARCGASQAHATSTGK